MAILHRIFIARNKRRKLDKQKRSAQNPNYLNILSSKNLKLVLPGRARSLKSIKAVLSVKGAKLKPKKISLVSASRGMQHVFKQKKTVQTPHAPSTNTRSSSPKNLNFASVGSVVKENVIFGKKTRAEIPFIKPLRAIREPAEKKTELVTGKISSGERRSIEFLKSTVTVSSVKEEFRTKKWCP
jgi:hypothetical protein